MLTLLALNAVLLQAPIEHPPPPALTRFLRQSIGFDAAQLAAVERGDAVVKVLETREGRDIAIFGIITSVVTREAYVARARDFTNSLRTPNRTQFGIFGNPPTAGDVQAVTITQRDVDDMKDCKPGDCVMKLPDIEMRRLRDSLNWSAPPPDIQAQMSAYARRRLLEYVADYRVRGDSAMAVYDDRGTMRVRASEAFASMLAASPYVYQNVPSLGQYLAAYPRAAPLPDAAEIIFWSEDALPRLRPILSVTHLVLYAPPEFPSVTLVAAKQIYANHYFEAALDLTCVVDRPGGGSYLLVLRRYRFDNLPGGILNIRGRAIGALRDQLSTDLRRQATR